jgi:hypothetical protein
VEQSVAPEEATVFLTTLFVQDLFANEKQELEGL